MTFYDKLTPVFTSWVKEATYVYIYVKQAETCRFFQITHSPAVFSINFIDFISQRIVSAIFFFR